MAFRTTSASVISFEVCPQALTLTSFTTKKCGLKLLVSFSSRSTAPRFQSAPLRLQVSCAAKPVTVQKVGEIVRKQLALTDETTVTGETRFSELGADSLDTVEIVMRLEEEFGVSVEEENAQSITTIQGAADLIEKLQE